MGQAAAAKTTWWTVNYPMSEFLPLKFMTLYERFVDICRSYVVFRGIIITCRLTDRLLIRLVAPLRYGGSGPAIPPKLVGDSEDFQRPAYQRHHVFNRNRGTSGVDYYHYHMN